MRRLTRRRKRKFKRKPKSTLDLMKVSLRAWKALPSPYRNDEALDYKFKKGFLTATPKTGQGLGNWEAVYRRGKWVSNV